MVTFLVKGDKDTENIVIFSSLSDQNDVISNNVCKRIKNTNIYYKTYILEKGLKTTYLISKNNPMNSMGFYENILENRHTLSPDPFNEKTFIQKYRRGDERIEIIFSVLEIPNLKRKNWISYIDNIPHGELIEIDLQSKILEMSRKIWIYIPPKIEKNKTPLNLLIIFDGKAFLEFTNIKNILDNLMWNNKIPPSLAVLVHNYSWIQRGKDLSCYPPFAEFVSVELLNYLRQNYSITKDPRKTVLIGSSSGALTASYIAIEYPQLFGNVLAQSGYFSWSPGIEWFQKSLSLLGKDYVHWWNNEDEEQDEWLTYYYSKHKKESLNFYLNVGKLETRAIESVRNFHQVLEEKGYSHKYMEYPGGHEYIAWNDYLSEGLIYLIGKNFF